MPPQSAVRPDPMGLHSPPICGWVRIFLVESQMGPDPDPPPPTSFMVRINSDWLWRLFHSCSQCFRAKSWRNSTEPGCSCVDCRWIRLFRILRFQCDEGFWDWTRDCCSICTTYWKKSLLIWYLTICLCIRTEWRRRKTAILQKDIF